MNTKNRVATGAMAVLVASLLVVGGAAAPASAGTYTKTYYASSSGGTIGDAVVCGLLVTQAKVDLAKRGYVITSYKCDAKKKKMSVVYTEAKNV